MPSAHTKPPDGKYEREDLFREFDVPIDQNDVPRDIEVLVERWVDDPEDGFFGPGSIMWRVNQENMIFLAGTAAVLLQVAHPMVSEAGVEHSDYEEDLAGRFERTFEIVDTIVFGDRDTAVQAALIVRRIHDGVTGELSHDTGDFQEGDSYYANRPDLLMWVHSTLIDQSLKGYEAYVAELSSEEKQRYYEESQVFGRLMGVPGEMYPETLDEFYNEYREMIERNISVGPTGREVIDGFYSQLGFSAPFARFLAGGTMPPEARDKLLEWGATRQRLFDLFAFGVRSIPLSILPDKYRYREKYRKFAME